MRSTAPLPFRPRLADHVLLRRHLVDGQARIVVHDTLTEERLAIDARQLAWLRCADGTRDLGGIVLAAVQRGAYRRSSELLELLGRLHERGMLADGIEAGTPVTGDCPERPLEPLPGYTLTCDHNGTCCGTCGAIPFSRAEAARARVLVPDAPPETVDDELFLPLHSSVDGPYFAVTLVDGHCPYLAHDGGCRIQRVAGPTAKPRGCQIFPATFVDDGVAVRVSVSVECPCVLASVGVAGGSPLVPAGARQRDDLWPETRVHRLSDPLCLSATRTGPLAELHEWSALLAARGAQLSDPLRALLALADCVRAHGLAVQAALDALETPATPAVDGWVMPLMALAGRAQAQRASAQAGCSPHDRTRQLTSWVARAATSLQEPERAAELLSSPSPALAHERFYWQATLFGHHLLTDPLPLDQALRERAMRLLLARQLYRDVPSECADHPLRGFGVAAVEAMMRGQGLAAYGQLTLGAGAS